MKIKLMLLTSMFLFLSLSLLAQDYKVNINKRFKEFSDLLVAGEYTKSMDYIPDAFFKIVSKEEFVAAFEQILKSKQVEYKIIDFKIIEIQESKKIDSNYYAKLKYTSTMKMRFIPSEPETPDEEKTRLNLAKNALINTFGADNVKLDELTGFFTITPTKKSFAISQNGITDWKFMNIETGQQGLLEKVLPKEIMETL